MTGRGRGLQVKRKTMETAPTKPSEGRRFKAVTSAILQRHSLRDKVASLNEAAQALLEPAVNLIEENNGRFPAQIVTASVAYKTLDPFDKTKEAAHFGVYLTEEDMHSWNELFNMAFSIPKGAEDTLPDLLADAGLTHWFKPFGTDDLYIRIGLPKEETLKADGTKIKSILRLSDDIVPHGRVRIQLRPDIYVGAELNDKSYSGVFLAAEEVTPIQQSSQKN